MSTNTLIQSFEKYIDLTNREKKLLLDHFIFREIPKNFKIIKYGEITNEWFYIKKGCVRLIYLKENGDEVTGFFFTENMFFTSLESMLTGIPSIQEFETLENTELYVLKKKNLEKLYDIFPKMNVFVRRLLEERFINAQRVVASLILLKPEERYYHMFKSQPKILNRVPQHTLATYLGITPVSLSRIRTRVLNH